MCYDYIQAAMLHLLDMDWQLYDLAFLVDIKLAELFMDLAKGTFSYMSCWSLIFFPYFMCNKVFHL